MEELTCTVCGGLLKDLCNGKYKCICCNQTFDVLTFDKQLATLRNLLDEQKQEKLSNLRQNLWQELQQPYLSSSEIINYAREIKKILPRDFFADFCIVANSGNEKNTAKLLDTIDTTVHKDYLCVIADFMLKSLKSAHLLAMNNFLERAFKATDLEKYAHYNSLLQQEAKRVEEGVYRLQLPRDAFIAYSSKDMDKVSQLVEELESQGLTCFVAQRNMQHGAGAVENYYKALQTAMDNCKVFVLVSSNNSRSTACDALTELEYAKKTNKPRVEYLIEDYTNKNTIGERTVKNFFEGLEYCYTAKDVAVRVLELKHRQRTSNSTTQSAMGSKYCTKCGTENPMRAKLCMDCGNGSFVDSQQEYLRYVIEKQKEDYKNQLSIFRQKAEENEQRLKVEVEEKERRLREQLEKLHLQDSKNQVEKEKVNNDKQNINKAEQTKYSVDLTNYDRTQFKIEGTVLKKYLGKETDVVIPKGVTSIADFAFLACASVNSIVIPEGVTSIGASAFYNCINLMSITLPNSLTSIGSMAFAWCLCLTTIKIPNNVTSIGPWSFAGCSSLTIYCKSSYIKQPQKSWIGPAKINENY